MITLHPTLVENGYVFAWDEIFGKTHIMKVPERAEDLRGGFVVRSTYDKETNHLEIPVKAFAGLCGARIAAFKLGSLQWSHYIGTEAVLCGNCSRRRKFGELDIPNPLVVSKLEKKEGCEHRARFYPKLYADQGICRLCGD